MFPSEVSDVSGRSPGGGVWGEFYTNVSPLSLNHADALLQIG